MADKKGGWCWHLIVVAIVWGAITMLAVQRLSLWLFSYFDLQNYSLHLFIVLLFPLGIALGFIWFYTFLSVARPFSLYHSCHYRKALRGKKDSDIS